MGTGVRVNVGLGVDVGDEPFLSNVGVDEGSDIGASVEIGVVTLQEYRTSISMAARERTFNVFIISIPMSRFYQCKTFIWP